MIFALNCIFRKNKFDPNFWLSNLDFLHLYVALEETGLQKIEKIYIFHIAFIIWKHHVAVKTDFGALFEVLDTSFLLQN